MTTTSHDAEGALAALSAEDGPLRFARVAPGLYRGGQPSARHLGLLRALGVRTVISLRREDARARRLEEAESRRLGMRFLHFPFYGVFGARARFLGRILDAMREAAEGGAIYLHCKHGRDRTSLLVALYRVAVCGWDPEDAWQREVVAYGHRPTWFYRKLHHAFRAATRGRAAP